MNGAPLTHRREGRNRATFLAVLVVWVVLLVAWFWLNAAWWVISFFFLFTLPALHDLRTNPRSSLILSEKGLNWQNRQQQVDLPLSRIKNVRLDTRWDFSVRATIFLTDGQKLRMPQDCLPPHRAFEAALESYGVKTERHHFRVF
jgi:hypothetical protein